MRWIVLVICGLVLGPTVWAQVAADEAAARERPTDEQLEAANERAGVDRRGQVVPQRVDGRALPPHAIQNRVGGQTTPDASAAPRPQLPPATQPAAPPMTAPATQPATRPMGMPATQPTTAPPATQPAAPQTQPAVGDPGTAYRPAVIPDPQPRQLSGAFGEAGLVQQIGEVVPTDVPFTDHAGDEVTLGELIGDRPAVLVLAYYTCPVSCPLMLGTLADRASDVDADLGEDYSVIVISIDPTDNPRTLDAAYREHVLGHDLPLNTDGRVVGWHMLTGTRPAIDAVAEAIGFRYGYDSEIQEYAHPTVTTLIEPSGRVNRYLEGLGFSGQTLHRSLIEASQGTLGTPLDAIIATCFVYDPARGNYVLFAKGAMKVGGAAIVGLVAVAVGGLLVREWRGRRAA